MREIKPPYGNPYWDEHLKPHPVSTSDIKELILDAMLIVMSSSGAAYFFDGVEEDDDDANVPKLLILYQSRAERKLSNTLLQLAILVRTLEDQINNSENAEKLRAHLSAVNEDLGPFGNSYGENEINLHFRECANKIIHAEDFRPVYDNDSGDRHDGGFFMTSELELEGRLGKKEWQVSINLIDFFEAALDFVEFCDLLEPA